MKNIEICSLNIILQKYAARIKIFAKMQPESAFLKNKYFDFFLNILKHCRNMQPEKNFEQICSQNKTFFSFFVVKNVKKCFAVITDNICDLKFCLFPSMFICF